MKCGQGKPFKSYQMGGLVTKGPARAASAADPDEGVYTAKMGKPPYDPDNESALTPKQRAAAQGKTSGVGKPPIVLTPGQRPSNARYTGEVMKDGKSYQSFRDATGREVLMPVKPTK